MSLINLDQFIPTTLRFKGSTHTTTEILTILFITTNDGNKILDFIAKMQRVVNQSQNTPNRREAVNYITWENNSSINVISGIKDMRIFLGQMYKPSILSKDFVQIAVLAQMYFEYYNKAIKQKQQNKLGLPATPTFFYNVMNNRAYLKSTDTIESFISQFTLFNSIDIDHYEGDLVYILDGEHTGTTPDNLPLITTDGKLKIINVITDYQGGLIDKTIVEISYEFFDDGTTNDGFYAANAGSKAWSKANNLNSIISWGNIPLSRQTSSLVNYGCFEAITQTFTLPADSSPQILSNTTFLYMFYGCTLFNSNIGHWDTSGVVDTAYMFYFATTFNQDIGNWDTSGVVRMYGMFYNTIKFNQDISSWNTSNVTNMTLMFRNARDFNQDINTKQVTVNGVTYTAWDVSSVTAMGGMLSGSVSGKSTNFNRDISNWDTSNVIYMWSLFRFNKSFNQNIGNWNTKKVVLMTDMFREAESFDQDLSGWRFPPINNVTGMFLDATKMLAQGYSSTPETEDDGTGFFRLKKSP